MDEDGEWAELDQILAPVMSLVRKAGLARTAISPTPISHLEIQVCNVAIQISKAARRVPAELTQAEAQAQEHQARERLLEARIPVAEQHPAVLLEQVARELREPVVQVQAAVIEAQ